MFAKASNLSDKQFAERLNKALRSGFSGADPVEANSGDPVHDGLRISAALHSTFSPPDLLPYGIRTVGPGAFQLILPDSHRLPVNSGGDSSMWTLNEDVRIATLSSLAADGELTAVLDEVSVPGGDLLPQLLREAWQSTSADSFRLTDRSEAQLTTLLRISRWIGNHLPGLPVASEISRQLDLDRLLATARHLADDKFSGRNEVLSDLRGLLGLDGSQKARPVMLHGPGGIGKSTLISQLLLDHTTSGREPRILFAWLDFDRPGLSPREPLTLLEDIVRQLALQLPELKNDFAGLKEDLSEFTSWTFNGETQMDDHHFESINFKRSSSSSSQEQVSLLLRLHDLLDRCRGKESRPRPLLLVLDTFEEVQFHHRDSIPRLFEYLGSFLDLIPLTRLLVSGRNFERDTWPLELEDFPLTELRPEDVRQFLGKHGVPETATSIIGTELGGNPLTLRLAMEVWKHEREAGTGWSGDPEAQKQFFRSVIGARVQGQLYRRILSHISDPTACALACPGLVLRRITPDLIINVLAGPCNLTIPTVAAAHLSFNALSREDSLVSIDGEALIHRSDVRRDMLRLLEESEPDRVAAIHAAAVNYYASFNPANRPDGTRPDLASAAEEIYHRYFLDDPEHIIESRWIVGIEPFLANALQDLPRTDLQQRLASRLGTEELGDRARRESDDVSWERSTIPKVHRCLDHDDYRAAIALLEERGYRSPGSRLYNMHAIALARLGNMEDALAVANQGLLSAEGQQESPDNHTLLSTIAGILRRTGKNDEAAKFYWRAGRSAEKTGGTLRAVEYYLLAAGICGKKSRMGVSRDDLVRMIERLLQGFSPSELVKERSLITQAILMIQGTRPESDIADGIMDYVKMATQPARKPDRKSAQAPAEAETILADISMPDTTPKKTAKKASSKKPTDARPSFPPMQSQRVSQSDIYSQLLERITSQFSENDLDHFTKENFDVRLKEISRGGSIRNTAEDFLLWSERTGNMDHLIRIMGD